MPDAKTAPTLATRIGALEVAMTVLRCEVMELLREVVPDGLQLAESADQARDGGRSVRVNFDRDNRATVLAGQGEGCADPGAGA